MEKEINIKLKSVGQVHIDGFVEWSVFASILMVAVRSIAPGGLPCKKVRDARRKI